MLKTPCAPWTSRADSSASRRAARNSCVPGLAFFRASAAATAAKTDPRGKKVLGLADIARWKRINNAALSSDGAWMTFVYQPNEGDMVLKQSGLTLAEAVMSTQKQSDGALLAWKAITVNA